MQKLKDYLLVLFLYIYSLFCCRNVCSKAGCRDLCEGVVSLGIANLHFPLPPLDLSDAVPTASSTATTLRSIASIDVTAMDVLAASDGERNVL